MSDRVAELSVTVQDIPKLWCIRITEDGRDTFMSYDGTDVMVWYLRANAEQIAAQYTATFGKTTTYTVEPVSVED